MNKLLLSACIAATACLPGCRHAPKHPAMPPIPVVVTAAQTDSIPTRMNFIGYLASNFDAVIQPRVSGYLRSIRYDNGMPVKRGQLLFTIEPDLLSTSVLAARASLESARAQAVEAQNNYERAVPLARINAISQSQLDQYTAQNKAAEAAVHSAEQNLRNASLEMSYTNIYSPIDGIAAVTNAHAGDYVGPGTQFSVLTTVSNLDTMTVNLSIPMTRYLQLAGARSSIYDNAGILSDIRLTLSDETQYPHEGLYDYTLKNISGNTGDIVLVAMFPNPQRTLKQGQFARVSANVGPVSPRIVVPQQCVSQAQGVNSVWIVKPDSTAEYRKVELGPTYGGLWCIDSGVDQGEWVVVAGRQKLHEGMKVAPAKP